MGAYIRTLRHNEAIGLVLLVEAGGWVVIVKRIPDEPVHIEFQEHGIEGHVLLMLTGPNNMRYRGWRATKCPMPFHDFATFVVGSPTAACLAGGTSAEIPGQVS